MPDILSRIKQQGEQRAEGLKRLNLTWKHKVGTIQEGTGAGRKMIWTSFYTSTYKCPKCGSFLLEACAPISFDTDEKKYVSARNVYACSGCKNLFVSEYTAKLGCGEYYMMEDTSKFHPAVGIISNTAPCDPYFVPLEPPEPLKIFEDDWGELHCNYHGCRFRSDGICYGGPYQCPNKVERARVCLPRAIEAYEDLKSRPYGGDRRDEEWLRDLAELESRVRRYKGIINGEPEVRTFIFP